MGLRWKDHCWHRYRKAAVVWIWRTQEWIPRWNTLHQCYSPNKVHTSTTCWDDFSLPGVINLNFHLHEPHQKHNITVWRTWLFIHTVAYSDKRWLPIFATTLIHWENVLDVEFALKGQIMLWTFDKIWSPVLPFHVKTSKLHIMLPMPFRTVTIPLYYLIWSGIY